MTPVSPARAHAAAPSLSDPAVKAAAAAIALQLRAMTAEHDKAVTGDVEAIHRLRVATRRLRAALRMLCEVAPEGRSGERRRRTGMALRRDGRGARSRRARTVAPGSRDAPGSRFYSRTGAALRYDSPSARDRAEERLVAALDSERYGGLVQRLGAIAPEPAADSVTLGAVAARLVRPSCARCCARARDSTRPRPRKPCIACACA